MNHRFFETQELLPYISRTKDNQTMTFGQVIKFNILNIFLEKSCTKCGGKTNRRPFS